MLGSGRIKAGRLKKLCVGTLCALAIVILVAAGEASGQTAQAADSEQRQEQHNDWRTTVKTDSSANNSGEQAATSAEESAATAAAEDDAQAETEDRTTPLAAIKTKESIRVDANVSLPQDI